MVNRGLVVITTIWLPFLLDRQSDRCRDRRTDGWTYGHMDIQTDGQINGQTDCELSEYKNKRSNIRRAWKLLALRKL